MLATHGKERARRAFETARLRLARMSSTGAAPLATVFRELRDGKTSDGVSIKKPATACSTAEAIGVAIAATLHARFFGQGQPGAADIARNMVGAIVKEDLADLAVLKEYVSVVAKKRAAQDAAWKEFHAAAQNLFR